MPSLLRVVCAIIPYLNIALWSQPTALHHFALLLEELIDGHIFVGKDLEDHQISLFDQRRSVP